MPRRLALALALTALAPVLAGCGGAEPPGTARRPAAEPAPAAPPPPPPQRLPIGVSEANANLLAPGTVPAPFAAWRDRVAALHPTYYRLVVDWSKLQPDPSRPPDLAQPQSGCLRGERPCGGWAGIRGDLEAIAQRRRAEPGRWNVLVVIYGVPAWAARAPGGCERSDAQPRARPITEQGLQAYEALIGHLLALGRQTGVPLRWWAPWNEPNHPAFISPQRASCDPASPSLAPGVYASLARAAKIALDADPSPHDLVLGELAGYGRPTPRTSSISELVAGLPDDVACTASVWSVHDYVRPDGGGVDGVAALEQALAARPCTADKPIWVTETGAGGSPPGSLRPVDPADLRAQCRALAQRLLRWDADPRVGAAFQYTVREDPLYPVGLADPTLRTAYPSYDVWRAWADAPPDHSGPPPAAPASCAG